MASEHIRTEIDTDGSRPAVTKSGRGAGAERIRSEAAVLAAARHPGVVELLEGSPATDADGTVRLRTRVAGSRTLATLGPVDPARAAGLLAALATTVDDLHDLGIRHGRLTADHVIVARDGRPVLCGFAEASNTAGGRHSPADDVAALGRLLHDLVAPADDTGERPPAHRIHLRRTTSHHHRGALLNLADQATADDPNRRPTAAQLAAALRATVPDAHLHDDEIRPTDPPPLRRSGIALAAALGAVAVVAVAVSTWSGGHTTDAAAPGATPTSTSTTAIRRAAPADPGAATEPTTSRPGSIAAGPGTDTTRDDAEQAEDPFARAAGCATLGGIDAATTADGAPCASEIHLVDGLLTVGTDRFDLELDTAAVALGDFTCSGRTQPAVADLAAGHVFVFDRWATTTQTVDAAAIAHVDAPRQLLAEPDPRGCHRLVVLDEWGLRHVVDVTSEPTS